MNRKRKAFTLIEFLVVIASIVGVAALTGSAKAQDGGVSWVFDNQHIDKICVNGINVLTGGGVYMIGSLNGDDTPETNYGTTGGTNGHMTNGGPPFSFVVSSTSSPNVKHFVFTVGPIDRARIQSLGVAFDFDKRIMMNWAFNGSRYHYWQEPGNPWHSGNSGTYAQIPTPGIIRNQAGQVLGRVGVAIPDGLPSWGQISGPVATARVSITRQTGAHNISFTNHFGTNNIGIDLGPVTRGQTVRVEGNITVTPTADPQVRFEAERDLARGVGHLGADGVSVSVRDPAGGWITYGPYNGNFAGQHTAEFRLLVDNNTADNIALVDLDCRDATTGQILATRRVRRRDFAAAWQYQSFVLSFSIPAGHQLETRARIVNSVSYVREDAVVVR